MGKIEAINGNKELVKSLKVPKKIVRSIKKKKKKKKKKRIVQPVKIEETEILKPSTSVIEPMGIESILKEDVIYPDVKIDIKEIEKVSKELNKRVS